MGDSNVESSNLARKVMKIDGNPRVNLLRGSSKGNDASKTNSSSRYPVRGTAVDLKMTINPKLIEQESELLASFRVASLDEERFLKQKSKVHWLAEGDANTKYFHNTLKCRNHRARIDVITDSNGILHDGKEVPKAFVDHYVGFLGREEAVIIPITQELFDVRIDQAMSVDMIREVTVDEIKRTIFAFADDKAPGPDGFTAAFYKKAWEIVDDLFLFARGELSSAKEL
ncbi:hypothetical protein QVD17_06681 [Tagetes erecta]|uniref:RNA-directed DNA polymerase, eukaryota, reverse transcriptase zinc-binding domain protein n=1 Tax=Tagetes erecta TaxID=13708 RepID=A0AAD8LEN5_TARER|nr:hypothetical protein QVD17_06681 [Tagetes erecta]